MKKISLRIFSIIAVLVLVLSVLPVGALADDEPAVEPAPSDSETLNAGPEGSAENNGEGSADTETDETLLTEGNEEPSAPAAVLRAPGAEDKPYEGKIIILHTNDVHGAIDKYANVAAIKDEFYDKGAKSVILVDAGDFSQGTPYVSESKGQSAVDLMIASDYDIITLGNHEFDYGVDVLNANLTRASEGGIETVCVNVRDSDGYPFVDSQAYNVTVNIENCTVGFFGLTTPESQTKANPAKIKGVVFDVGEKMQKDIEAAINDMDDADIIICLAHLGVDPASSPYRSTDVYRDNSEYIDFIIDGHSHTVMTKGEGGEPIQSTGTKLANVGVIVIDPAERKIVDNFLYKIDENTPVDEEIAAQAKEIIDDIDAKYSEPFAVTEVYLPGNDKDARKGETALGDLITDAMLWTVLKDGSLELPEEDYLAVTNGGGVRAALPQSATPDGAYPMEISQKDVNTVLPFGNTLTVSYVKGSDLLEALEASTFKSPDAIGGFPQVAGIHYTINTAYEYDPQDEQYPGSTYHGPKTIRRVTIKDVNGKPFDPEKTYGVVTNDFCSSGGDTYYRLAQYPSFDTGIPLDEAVMAFVTEELDGVIGEPYGALQGRIVFINEPVPEPVPTENPDTGVPATLPVTGYVIAFLGAGIYAASKQRKAA